MSREKPNFHSKSDEKFAEKWDLRPETFIAMADNLNDARGRIADAKMRLAFVLMGLVDESTVPELEEVIRVLDGV